MGKKLLAKYFGAKGAGSPENTPCGFSCPDTRRTTSPRNVDSFNAPRGVYSGVGGLGPGFFFKEPPPPWEVGALASREVRHFRPQGAGRGLG